MKPTDNLNRVVLNHERRIEELEQALREIIATLGPTAPACEGCAVEVEEALRIAKKTV